MLPAQPPNSRRMRGTRNDTFRIWTLSGRMWFLNWSGNTMMVSKAREPQIKADIGNGLYKWGFPPADRGGGGGARGARRCKGYRLRRRRARTAAVRRCPEASGAAVFRRFRLARKGGGC